MRAAICEDELRTLKTLQEYIEHGFAQLSMDLSVDSFSNPEDLEKAIEDGAKIDVFFLDIEMPGLSGI